VAKMSLDTVYLRPKNPV